MIAEIIKKRSEPISRVLYRNCGGYHLSNRKVTLAVSRSTRKVPAMNKPSPARASNTLLFDLTRDEVCLAKCVTALAVGSYPTISALPALFSAGGIFSVALSVRDPSPDIFPAINRRRALSSPDFPPTKNVNGSPTHPLYLNIRKT